jgi:hypothetical protein
MAQAGHSKLRMASGRLLVGLEPNGYGLVALTLGIENGFLYGVLGEQQTTPAQPDRRQSPSLTML